MSARYNLRWLIMLLASTSLAMSISRRDAPRQAEEDMCFLRSARIAVAADILYFMGGKYTVRDGDSVTPQPRLYSIPLNKPFPVNGPLPPNNYYTTSASGQYWNQGAFFQDANATLLYSFGGYVDENPINALNTYNISSGEWSNVSVSGGDFNHNSRAAASRAISIGSSEALGFVAGGWEHYGGMIRFDASDPANPQWWNETDNSPPLTLEGSMNFIRFGPRGSLINFGGYPGNWPYDHRPMGQINVYDIDSATWYNVTAGGEVPSNRSAFCTAVSSAPDDSSFQITMYGGFGLFEERSYADTYVLSIPSFQWINVTDSDSSNLDAHLADGGGWSGRHHHQCIAYKDRQMFVLGGILRAEDRDQNLGECNDRYPATRALDLSTFQWSDDWNGNPPEYFVPDAVTDIIGGNGQGGAEMISPTGGFNDSALNTIFARVVPRYTPQPISAASGDPTSGDGDGSSSSGTSASTIIGGVVGGIAALALLAAVIFLVLRRRRRRRAATTAAAPQPYPQQPGNKYDGKPVEMGDHTSKNIGAKRGYYEPVPVTQEMDGGYRGSEIEGSTGSGFGSDFGNEMGNGYADGRWRRSELPG